ncbi:MAG: ribonuclease D, partial [Acidimicrobiales bacterium]
MDQAEFDDLIGTLAGQQRIAVDTEFHREKTYFPRVALIQIAWEGGLVLVDPLELDLAALAGLVQSDLLVVMHAAGQDLEVFDRVCGAVPLNL